MSQTSIDAKSRQEMIDAEIDACTECNRAGFTKRHDCDGCIAAVDALIATLRHEDDK